MMNRETLDRFIHLAVEGAGPQRRTLPHLQDDEQDLYQYLVDYADRNPSGLLLEQERIPWDYAYPILLAGLRRPPGLTTGRRRACICKPPGCSATWPTTGL
jgi:hypothetical protein